MDPKKTIPSREVELEYIRYATITRCGLPARVGFKAGNALFGVYWAGDVEGWTPVKWGYPNGNYRVNGHQSDLDLSLGDDWTKFR